MGWNEKRVSGVFERANGMILEGRGGLVLLGPGALDLGLADRLAPLFGRLPKWVCLGRLLFDT